MSGCKGLQSTATLVRTSTVSSQDWSILYSDGRAFITFEGGGVKSYSLVEFDDNNMLWPVI